MASADQTLFQSRPTPPLPRALLAILPVLAAAILGSVATTPNIPVWYEGLEKPGFTPPNWVFAPVWTVLYLMMAYAAWRVMSVPADFPGRSAALAVFFVQLALNAAWSWAFFGFHSPLAGLIVIVALLAMILATIRLFWHLDRVAAWLLVPYALWVTYALALNFAVWRLNG
jgi:tryptophan-rich sensory protein